MVGYVFSRSCGLRQVGVYYMHFLFGTVFMLMISSAYYVTLVAVFTLRNSLQTVSYLLLLLVAIFYRDILN